MSTKLGKSVLAVIAHPDDLELMAGGAIAKWANEGVPVHVLTFTDGVWKAPDGTKMRDGEEALAEERAAAECLGYTVENLQLPAMDLKFEDRLVVEVLKRIENRKVDTLVCPWEKDSHHDHEMASRIAMAASRRVPRMLTGQINYYLREFFAPNVFIDITDTWEKKIESLKCFKGQWGRAGDDWFAYLDETTRYYGRIMGVKRAEGFISNKFLV